MKLRAFLAVTLAMFDRPAFNDAPRIEHTHVAEAEGLVSPESSFRIKTAFQRFARFIGGGG